jgi:PAS domain S-box-containing protein
MRIQPLRSALVLVLVCLLPVLFFLLGIVSAGAQFRGLFLLPAVLVFLFLILGGAACLLAQHRHMQAQLARREQELDDLVKVRTAELEASERKYRDLYDNSPDMYFVGLPTEQVILDCNQTMARALGYTREELIGRSTSTLFEPASYVRLDAHRAEFLAEHKGDRFDLQLQCKDGTLLDVLVSGTVEPDPAGGPPMARVTLHDITERKRLEEQLRDSEERFRLIVQNSPDIIALYDADGSMVYISPAIELIYGLSAERALDRDPLLMEALATPPGKGLHAVELARVRALPQFADRRTTAAAVAYCLKHPGEQHRVEVANTLMSGEVKYFDTAYRAHQRAGGSWQVVSITRDTTDRKRLEQALQTLNAELENRVAARTADLQSALTDLQAANQLKDEFMAMISHELRTPLTGVLSLSEMLEEQVAGPLTERQSFYVKGIVASGERLLNVVNGILSYTHLLAGKVRLDAESCALAYLLAVCAASQQHKAEAKSQSIVVRVEPADLAIMGDASAISEVLKRLLDNAIKFTPAGGQIGLEARPTPMAGNDRPATVDLVVWDTGIGIAPDQVDHVFHAFTQADSRLARSHEGIGLGLAYVDAMVCLMGGTVTLTSTPGAGSRLTIALPE